MMHAYGMLYLRAVVYDVLQGQRNVGDMKQQEKARVGHVGVDKEIVVSELVECCSKVDGKGGLTYSTFPGDDTYYVWHLHPVNMSLY